MFDSGAVERGRLVELARLDARIAAGYEEQERLWAEWERVAASLRGDA